MLRWKAASFEANCAFFFFFFLKQWLVDLEEKTQHDTLTLTAELNHTDIMIMLWIHTVKEVESEPETHKADMPSVR